MPDAGIRIYQKASVINRTVIAVGNGANDEPILAHADIGMTRAQA